MRRVVNAAGDRRFLLTNPPGYGLTYNGMVTAVEKRRSHGWQAFGSYTLSRASGLQASSGAAAADMLRAMGSVDVPRTGLAFAANVQYFSGKPWAATAQIALPQGDQRILLEPRGSRRLSSQTLVDLRVSRTFSPGGSTRVELFVDVLNALNDTAEEGLATDTLVSPNFGLGAAFIDPRRAMFAVRLNLGR